MTNRKTRDLLIAYQANPDVHPFTCPNRTELDHPVREGEHDFGMLVPDVHDEGVGLRCRDCGYRRTVDASALQMCSLLMVGSSLMAAAAPHREDAGRDLPSLDVRGRAVMAQDIPDDHWLHEERFTWMLRGIRYAATQTHAIPALAQCTPGQIAHVVWAVMRGGGLRVPDEPPTGQRLEAVREALGEDATDEHVQAVLDAATRPLGEGSHTDE